MKAKSMPWNTACRWRQGVLTEPEEEEEGEKMTGRKRTHKAVQLPPEPPLVDAAVQLKEAGDGPHGEDALEELLRRTRRRSRRRKTRE